MKRKVRTAVYLVLVSPLLVAVSLAYLFALVGSLADADD